MCVVVLHAWVADISLLLSHISRVMTEQFLYQLFTVIFTFILHNTNSIKLIIVNIHFVSLHVHVFVLFLHITLNMIQIPHTAVNGSTNN